MPEEKIRKILIGHKDYPQLLKQIHDPPKVLYVRGSIEILNTPAFGVVGTRKISEYGKSATPHIVSDISASGFTIVSGMAHGVDTLAHKTALNVGGLTVAVLGTGVDDKSIYPADNLGLAHRIIESGGAIISEYEPGTEGKPFTFPQRNRIISGMSRGVLVIEADEKSGSLITAKCAIDQNRDVFAVPGSIFSRASKGTNSIIKKGAKLVSSAEDVLEEYGDIKLQTTNNKPQIRGANEIEEKILEILNTNSGPMNINDIIRSSGLDAQKITTQLVMMEITKKIKKVGDKFAEVISKSFS
ncbi:MAG: DNA-processing protein DprA [bacterium]|nr:DNA-processing protein DprA [bacterium]